MARRRIGLAVLTALALDPAGGSHGRPAMAADWTADEQRIADRVAADLRTAGAATASDLIPGAPARALVAASMFTLEHGDGRGRIVVLGLAPGPPGELRVPTAMEYLRYFARVDGAEVWISGRPERDDLVSAVTRVLADEAKALQAASQALTDAGVPLPPGFATWRDALHEVTYDSRLPRARFVGDPNWSFIFEPWREHEGGWNHVLLNGALRVQLVNGRAPGPN